MISILAEIEILQKTDKNWRKKVQIIVCFDEYWKLYWNWPGLRNKTMKMFSRIEDFCLVSLCQAQISLM